MGETQETVVVAVITEVRDAEYVRRETRVFADMGDAERFRKNALHGEGVSITLQTLPIHRDIWKD